MFKRLLKCVVFIFLLLNISSALEELPNTCKTWDDYYKMENNPNCWYNPEIYMNSDEFAEKNGYHLENYTVTTDDGYIITMFRLPKTRDARGVIFLLHPATSSSDIWMDKSNKSLGFMLFDLGYDVWLPNLRGNKYARKHLSLNPETAQFWNHSFHEMAYYDIPVQLDVVQKVTKAGADITFLGHSMGGTIGVLYPILYADKAARQLKEIIAVSAAVQFNYNRNFIARLFSDNADFLLSVFTTFNQLEIFSPLLSPLFRQVCVNYNAGVELCANIFNFIMGGTVNGLVPEFYPKVFSHQPVGISAKVFIHYLQCQRNKRFQQFDFGPEGNKVAYDSSLPPKYMVENIKVPIHFISGDLDTLCSVEDNQEIFERIPAPFRVKHLIFKNFNHMDFVYGPDFYLFNKYIVRHLNKLYPKKS